MKNDIMEEALQPTVEEIAFGALLEIAGDKGDEGELLDALDLYHQAYRMAWTSPVIGFGECMQVVDELLRYACHSEALWMCEQIVARAKEEEDIETLRAVWLTLDEIVTGTVVKDCAARLRDRIESEHPGVLER
jgi:hypothetical protein